MASNRCTDVLRRRTARPADASDPEDLGHHVDGAEDVRRSVAGALTVHLSIPANRIDVTVEDVFVDEGAADD